MGTRGKFGFFYKGKYYTCYNHFDSYPRALGVNLLLGIINADLDEWIRLLESIREVSNQVKPTQEEINNLKKYTDLTVGKESPEDWFCLLRFTQGSFHHVLHSGYMENVQGVDLYEEYSYVLDLDNKMFRAKGKELKEVNINLEKEEMMKYVKEWPEEEVVNEKYDPEEKLRNEKKARAEMYRAFKFPGDLKNDNKKNDNTSETSDNFL